MTNTPGKITLVEKGNPAYAGVYTRRKQDGTLVFILNYRKNGKPVFDTLVGKWTKKSAALERAKRIQEAKQTSWLKPGSKTITFEAAYLNYLNYLRRQKKSEATIKGITSYYEKHMKNFLGRYQMKKICPDQLENWQDYLLDKDQSNISTTTATQVWVKAKSIWKRAVKERLYSGDSPWSYVENLRAKRHRLRFLNHEEVKQILTGLKKKNWIREWRVASIALNTGLRPPSEIQELCPLGIDMENNTITIGLLKQKVKGGGQHSTRTIPLSATVKNIVREMYNEHSYGPMESLFPIINRTRFKKVMLPLNKGIAKDRQDLLITPYSFRHTYASWLLAQGVDLKVIQELMGHKTLAITADIYAKHQKSAMTDAQARLNDAKKSQELWGAYNRTGAYPKFKIVG